MGVPNGPWYIDDTLTFTVNTHTVTTGAGTDADSVPTYRIYEDETGTAILNGSTAKLDDSNTVGFYSEQITLSAANGFEVGKSYSIYVAATVNSVAATYSYNFKVVATAAAANVTQWLGTAVATPTTAGVPEVDVTYIAGSVADLATDAEIADAVWDEAIAGHADAGSTGEALSDAGGAGTPPTVEEIADEVQTRTIAAVTTVNGLAANTVTASALATDAVTEIQSGLATSAAQTTALVAIAAIDDLLDTEMPALTTAVADLPTNAELATALGTADDAVLTQIALVKSKTDSLTFTVANVLDANIQRVNDVAVAGTGAGGDEWGPA